MAVPDAAAPASESIREPPADDDSARSRPRSRPEDRRARWIGSHRARPFAEARKSDRSPPA